MNWYEHHGYVEDPFSSKNVFIEKTVTLIEPADELAYNVEAGNMVVIEGGKGTGKTTLLRSVIERFRGERKVAYFDCSKNEIDMKKLMQGKYGIIGRMLNLTPNGMVVLLDNFTKLSKKDVERAKYYYDNNYIRSIVFAGPASALPDNVRDRVGPRVIKLKPLGPNDAVELVKNRMGSLDFLPENAISKIHKKSRANTLKFLELCSNACAAATKAGADKVNQTHINGGK